MTSILPPPQPASRKTRIVCISDTHNQTPKLPAGDVLIHSGDLTNQGSLSELKKQVAWLEAVDFEVKIVIAGNHDITLDTQFYEQHGAYFHNQHPQNVEECQRLLTESPSITYLKHEAKIIRLSSPEGPRTSFKVFGSPYSPALKEKRWAFQYEEAEAAELWSSIPLDADVVITHAPPATHLDASAGRSAGCEALRRALWGVRPSLAVCGHCHESRGAERVHWNLDLPHCPFLEDGVEVWTDPGKGSNKQSLVDLTAKGGKPLENYQPYVPSMLANRVSFIPSPPPVEVDGKLQASTKEPVSHQQLYVPRKAKKTAIMRGLAERSAAQAAEPVAKDEVFSRLDAHYVDPLEGRMGRKETCVVNAAIMAASYGGPKRFNKPIVVDIDLPVWRG